MKGDGCDETLTPEEDQLVDRGPFWINRDSFAAGDYPSRQVSRVRFLVDDDRFPHPCDCHTI